MNPSDKQSIYDLTNSIISSSFVESMISTWEEYHSQIPETLYHYTSADGLLGILSSKSLWMTELRYMNDLFELQYSRNLIEKRFSVKFNEPELSEIQKDFINRISKSFDPFSYSGKSVFSTSFCEDGNLLSQWRAYRGSGGGYAIGIDFFHTIRFLNKVCVLRSVIYDEAEQIRLIDSAINSFFSALSVQEKEKSTEYIKDEFLPALCMAFNLVIGEYMFSFKHPDFREEREWRLVHFTDTNLTHNRQNKPPLFRSFDGNIIPYMAVSLEEAIKISKDDLYGLKFPIVILNIGPTIDADLNVQSIRTLLLSLNPDFAPNIERSEIPLRWL